MEPRKTTTLQREKLMGLKRLKYQKPKKREEKELISMSTGLRIIFSKTGFSFQMLGLNIL